MLPHCPLQISAKNHERIYLILIHNYENKKMIIMKQLWKSWLTESKGKTWIPLISSVKFFSSELISNITLNLDNLWEASPEELCLSTHTQADRQTDRQTHTHTDKVYRSHSPQTVTINWTLNVSIKSTRFLWDGTC